MAQNFSSVGGKGCEFGFNWLLIKLQPSILWLRLDKKTRKYLKFFLGGYVVKN